MARRARRGKYDDFNPWNGGVFARVAAGRRADAARAVAAAAFPAWSRSLPAERQTLFLRAADILEKKRDEIVAVLAEETGCAFGFAMFQETFTPGLLSEAAAQSHQTVGEIIPSDLPGSLHMAVRQPVGVVAGIALWNAPLILSLRSICMPIAFGNTAVLKPSSESAVAGGVAIAEVFKEAGFPKGVLNLVTNGPGSSREIGDEFVENPKVRRINLTGSTAVGRELAEKAGRHLKRDADIDQAVDAAVFGGFLHQGQICMSMRRVIIEKPVSREFTGKFVKKVASLKVGDPKEPDTVIGPLINGQQLGPVRGTSRPGKSSPNCGGSASGARRAAIPSDRFGRDRAPNTFPGKRVLIRDREARRQPDGGPPARRGALRR
jgi:aldehyde dehydrogenase (NAD+)